MRKGLNGYSASCGPIETQVPGLPLPLGNFECNDAAAARAPWILDKEMSVSGNARDWNAQSAADVELSSFTLPTRASFIFSRCLESFALRPPSSSVLASFVLLCSGAFVVLLLLDWLVAG